MAAPSIRPAVDCRAMSRPPSASMNVKQTVEGVTARRKDALRWLGRASPGPVEGHAGQSEDGKRQGEGGEGPAELAGLVNHHATSSRQLYLGSCGEAGDDLPVESKKDGCSPSLQHSSRWDREVIMSRCLILEQSSMLLGPTHGTPTGGEVLRGIRKTHVSLTSQDLEDDLKFVGRLRELWCVEVGVSSLPFCLPRRRQGRLASSRRVSFLLFFWT